MSCLLKHKIYSVVLLAFFCMPPCFASVAEGDYKFSITTMSLPDDDSVFYFWLTAAGDFIVDCGEDGTLSGDGVTDNLNIKREDASTNDNQYVCTYATGGVKTIRFGGRATDYNPDRVKYSAIFFESAQITQNSVKIASIKGSLGAIFPVAGGVAPSFAVTFHSAYNLREVPENLFSGINGVGDNMFLATFKECKSLESIPAGLFSGVRGNAKGLFESTFADCTKLKSIPDGLFSNITGSAPSMFSETFMSTGIEHIPEHLFAGVYGNADHMFFNTFDTCVGLKEIPADLFSRVTGSAPYMFFGTFTGCDHITSIPEKLFQGVKGSAEHMFAYTFAWDDSLKAIPKDLFSGVTGGAEGMFEGTFMGSISLETIPPKLFCGVDAPAKEMFARTFDGCSSLNSYIPYNTFAGLIANNAPSSDGMWLYTFDKTGLLTECPGDTKQKITGYEDVWKAKSGRAVVSCEPKTVVPVVQKEPQEDVFAKIKEIIDSQTFKNLRLSVWKDDEGNFNTARLISDSVASVVLGTASGVITSQIIKKNQIENGLEKLKCTINGQNVASFGDEFIVGYKEQGFK